MSGWDFNSGGSGGTKAEFTKFPVGLTKIRIIDDEPFIRWTHWLPKFSRSINCPGKGCPICEIRRQQKANKESYTYGMGRRFAINIINRETGKQEIMEQGLNFFNDLRDLLEDLKSEGKTLIDVDLKVRRRGTGKDDTSYRIDIDKDYPLSDADKTLIGDKVNLPEYFKPHTVEQILRIVSGEDWDAVMKSGNEDDSDSSEKDEEIELS